MFLTAPTVKINTFSLKTPVPGQTASSNPNEKKRRTLEELSESERQYEKKKIEKVQPQWRDRWNWLGFDETNNVVFCDRCPADK